MGDKKEDLRSYFLPWLTSWLNRKDLQRSRFGIRDKRIQSSVWTAHKRSEILGNIHRETWKHSVSQTDARNLRESNIVYH